MLSLIRETKHRVHGKRQTCDSNFETFTKRNEQIKTA